MRRGKPAQSPDTAADLRTVIASVPSLGTQALQTPAKATLARLTEYRLSEAEGRASTFRVPPATAGAGTRRGSTSPEAPTRARIQRCPTRGVNPSHGGGGAIVPHEGRQGHRHGICHAALPGYSRLRRGGSPLTNPPAPGGDRGPAAGLWLALGRVMAPPPPAALPWLVADDQWLVLAGHWGARRRRRAARWSQER